jgi:hypothetical protein
MDSGKPKIGTERAHRIIRMHHWIHFVILAVVLPAIFIVIGGYRSIWEVIIFFGCFGFIVWLERFFLWAKKRIEEFDEDKK